MFFHAIDFSTIIMPILFLLTLWAITFRIDKEKPSILFIGSLIIVCSLSLLPTPSTLTTTRQHGVELKQESNLSSTSIEFAFSPKQGATAAIVGKIQKAKKTIMVAAFDFTSMPIAQALIDAHKRGVAVMVVLDGRRSAHKHSLFSYLLAHDLQVRTNHSYAIMHNKFIIIDGVTLQSGSFNYSAAAEKRNAENILFIQGDPRVMDAYLKEWNKLWAESDAW